MRKKKILQIIPAEGWQYVCKDDDGSEMVDPLVCWALVELDTGDRAVEGMAFGDYIDFVEDLVNFTGYRRSSEHHEVTDGTI